MVRESLTEEEWGHFSREGYVRLGRVLDNEELVVLGQRIDDIMLGTANVDYGRTMMQLDSDPEKDGRPGPQSVGHKGATLAYRKIQGLEYDPDYLAYMQKPLMQHICKRVYGNDTAVACFRAMFMNKPADRGTILPWHQDVGVGWGVGHNPTVTVWTALDPATIDNGCMQIVPGSHKLKREEYQEIFGVNPKIKAMAERAEEKKRARRLLEFLQGSS